MHWSICYCLTAASDHRKMAIAPAFQPPNTQELEEMRVLRMKEMKMEAVLKEIIGYFYFVLIVFFLSYQARDADSYPFAETIKNIFVTNSPSLSSVSYTFILFSCIIAKHCSHASSQKRWCLTRTIPGYKKSCFELAWAHERFWRIQHVLMLRVVLICHYKNNSCIPPPRESIPIVGHGREVPR